MAATIQAIGRCATNIGEVRDTCLNGLVQLLSNRDGKSVNVIRCKSCRSSSRNEIMRIAVPDIGRIVWFHEAYSFAFLNYKIHVLHSGENRR